MSQEIDIRLIVKRTVERQLTKGKISGEDYEAYLGALPDVEENSENIADRIYGTPADESEEPAPESTDIA